MCRTDLDAIAGQIRERLARLSRAYRSARLNAKRPALEVRARRY